MTILSRSLYEPRMAEDGVFAGAKNPYAVAETIGLLSVLQVAMTGDVKGLDYIQVEYHHIIGSSAADSVDAGDDAKYLQWNQADKLALAKRIELWPENLKVWGRSFLANPYEAALNTKMSYGKLMFLIWSPEALKEFFKPDGAASRISTRNPFDLCVMGLSVALSSGEIEKEKIWRENLPEIYKMWQDEIIRLSDGNYTEKHCAEYNLAALIRPSVRFYYQDDAFVEAWHTPSGRHIASNFIAGWKLGSQDLFGQNKEYVPPNKKDKDWVPYRHAVNNFWRPLVKNWLYAKDDRADVSESLLWSGLKLKYKSLAITTFENVLKGMFEAANNSELIGITMKKAQELHARIQVSSYMERSNGFPVVNPFLRYVLKQILTHLNEQSLVSVEKNINKLNKKAVGQVIKKVFADENYIESWKRNGFDLAETQGSMSWVAVCAIATCYSDKFLESPSIAKEVKENLKILENPQSVQAAACSILLIKNISKKSDSQYDWLKLKQYSGNALEWAMGQGNMHLNQVASSSLHKDLKNSSLKVLSANEVPFKKSKGMRI